MNEKIILALKNAEETYTNLKSSGQKEHIMALHALYDSFIYYGLAVSQTPEAICQLEEGSYLHQTLIEPHLRVVDDLEMIANQYSLMYVKYIAKLAGGCESQEAVQELFT
ncbi:MAG: hypothetical protein COA44_12155 [Arcobacter sp.]|nr:MAG: hypothetical protein COA44_12155 [Arcobacter sp.]